MNLIPNSKSCPLEIAESFADYRDNHVPPGSFVQACLENNLIDALRLADANNLLALPHIVAWLYWNMPSNLWMSPKAVHDHLAVLHVTNAELED